MASATLLDRQFLEKLERLTIHWEKSFSGLVGGHNSSRFAGGGQEFLDHRHFHHGDDLRAVNWRAYMRLEKMFLKMFQIEPRVPVRMLLDVSESMAAGDSTKFEVRPITRREIASFCSSPFDPRTSAKTFLVLQRSFRVRERITALRPLSSGMTFSVA